MDHSADSTDSGGSDSVDTEADIPLPRSVRKVSQSAPTIRDICFLRIAPAGVSAGALYAALSARRQGNCSKAIRDGIKVGAFFILAHWSICRARYNRFEKRTLGIIEEKEGNGSNKKKVVTQLERSIIRDLGKAAAITGRERPEQV